jgi:predicted metal-dependent hydrolase
MNTDPTPFSSTDTQLLVRRLEVDLRRGFPRHWHGGDAFRSQFFNALSMSFPVGEQFFIDSVRDAAKLLPDTPRSAAIRATVAGFIGQEATHRHIHGLYNSQLEKQGLVNRWQHWAQARLTRLRARSPALDARHALAATCAFEHLTALLADGTLRYPRWLEGAEPDLQTVWRWHAAEETEHNAVAFDLYRELGGSYGMRLRWYLYVCLTFLRDASAQTLLNLHHDGSLWRPSTWWNAGRLLFGADGLAWRCTGPALQYLRRDFHPSQDSHATSAQTLASRWLSAHSNQWRPVRG